MIEAVTTSPLFGIVLCIGTFQIGRWVQKKTGLTLANPLVIAILLCIGVLLIFDIPYEDFAIGGDIVNMMLGPATAVLALNIYNQYAVLKRHFVPVLVGCTAGSLFSLASVLLLCRLFRLDEAVTAAAAAQRLHHAHRRRHCRKPWRHRGHHHGGRARHRVHRRGVRPFVRQADARDGACGRGPCHRRMQPCAGHHKGGGAGRSSGGDERASPSAYAG